ncbi:FAD:protein FMN transferase [Aliikangiella sp. IMCC44359]|uniref:FAD:protein FMN transferase n=1 Tax=Aliikangiella sp. IMCC44359 TaxID=3459125 RepID=UPI00403B2B3B
MKPFEVHSYKNFFKVSFFAMASPCEILIYSNDLNLVNEVAKLAVDETHRIEYKFSRYVENNLCWQLNHSKGKEVTIDAETFALLEYARQLYELSDGLFDITSGVLRKIWSFKTEAKPPTEEQVKTILPQVGFKRIIYDEKKFILPEKMEIDFGGLGKEYCVDEVTKLLTPICQKNKASFLVNLGGDLSALSFNSLHPPWQVGVESVVSKQSVKTVISVTQGAVATSGSTKRVFTYKGKSYAHILNPKTGYPIEGAPRSVTVFASTCSLAGGMSTLAQLQGVNAEKFLKQSHVKHLCYW